MREMHDTLDVWVLDFPERSQAAHSVLMETFGIDAPTAERVLASAPAVVKRRVPPRIARRFQAALERAGARVELVPVGARPQLGAVPESLEPVRGDESLPPPSSAHDPFATVFDPRVPNHAFEITQAAGEMASPDHALDAMPLPSLDDGDPADPFGVGAIAPVPRSEPPPSSTQLEAPFQFHVQSVRPIEPRTIAKTPSHAPAAPVSIDKGKESAGSQVISMLGRVGKRLLMRTALAMTITIGGVIFIWVRGGDDVTETDAIAVEELGGKLALHMEARRFMEQYGGFVAGFPDVRSGLAFVNELYRAGAETVYITRMQYVRGVVLTSGTLLIELAPDRRDATRASVAQLMTRFVDTPQRPAPDLEVGQQYLRIVFIEPAELEQIINAHRPR